jgi:hypothetical protein
MRSTPLPGVHLMYDATTDVAYLELRPTGPADEVGPTLLLFEHDPAFAGAVGLDFGMADGRAIGLEFQFASATLPPALLLAAERIDGLHLERITEMRLGRYGRAESGRRERVQ